MLEVGKVIPITDFFVIVTATSRRHVQALSEEILKLLKEKKIESPAVEGKKAGWWVLLDAGSVVVHLLEEKAREYYDLDNLWADAKAIEWKERAKKPSGSSKA